MTARINLLPIECRRALEQRRQATLWTACCIIVLVILLMVHQVTCLLIKQTEVQLDYARTSIAHLQQTNNQMLAQRNRIGVIQKQLEISAALEQPDVPLALLQAVGDCCFELQSSVQLDTLRMDETTETANGKLAAGVKKSLTLVGSGVSDDSVSTLVGLLQATNLFRQVELKSSQAQSDQPFSHRLFQIRCVQ